MDDYKIVYKGSKTIVLPLEEVLNNLVLSLNITEMKAKQLIAGPKITLKVVHEEHDAVKFQSFFHQLGLSTDIIRPMKLVEDEKEYSNEGIEPNTGQINAEPLMDTKVLHTNSVRTSIKNFLFKSALFKLSNIVLFLGVLLVALYFPFIDGVVRYGFALGIVFMASSLSLKSVDR